MREQLDIFAVRILWAIRLRAKKETEVRRMNRARAVAAICLLVAVAMNGRAQQKMESKSYVLKAARMFDGKSNGMTSPGRGRGVGWKIAGVGAGATIPSDAEVIDLGDATLLPGFIDAHTHLTMQYREDYTRAALDNLQKPIPQMALESSVAARVTLMAGFTNRARCWLAILSGRGAAQCDQQRNCARTAHAGRSTRNRGHRWTL